ncbi:uroporphyrinogen-III synthase, partial [Aeromonas veronii]|nr:uroporphyrinogen-III synthase [Aeromonas veronii]
GRKTLNWTKKHALSVRFVSEDGTMENLLMTLSSEGQNNGKRLFLQAYNQDDEKLQIELEKQGYDVYLSKPYRFIVPPLITVRNLRQKILNKTLDAVIFTSKTQVQNLFNESLAADAMVKAFNEKVLAVAVGKVTANELDGKGITNLFQPSIQKMGAMVVELRKYLK